MFDGVQVRDSLRITLDPVFDVFSNRTELPIHFLKLPQSNLRYRIKQILDLLLLRSIDREFRGAEFGNAKLVKEDYSRIKSDVDC